MTATVRVRNAGRIASGRGTLTVLLSRDARPSADDQKIASAPVPGLRPHRDARVRVSADIPAAASAGPRSLLVCLPATKPAPKPAPKARPRLPRCLAAPVLVIPLSLPPDGPPAGGDPRPTAPPAYYFKVLDAAMTTHTLADKTNTEDQVCADSGFSVHGGRVS